MPSKSPSSFDSQDDWIDYCMSDSETKKEYPDEKQRYAVCRSYWDNKESGKTLNNPNNELIHMEDLRFNAPIKIKEAKESDSGIEKLTISGVAVTEGTSRNNVYYGSDVLKESAKTLEGKPLLMDHSQSTRDIVGKVVETSFKDGKIPFTAVVDTGEEDLVRKLRNGFIDFVSIGASFDKENSQKKEGVLHVQGLEMHELSFVPVPGVANATLSQVIAEKFKTHHQGDKMEKEKFEEELEKLKKENEELKTERDSLQTQLHEDDEDEEEVKEQLKSLHEAIQTLKEQDEEEEEEEPEEGEVDAEETEEKASGLIKERASGGTVRFYKEDPLGFR